MPNLTDQEALDWTRGAFSPLQCGAEIFDFGERLRLRVVNHQNETLLIDSIARSEFQDSDRLRALIEQYRTDLEHHKGVNFDRWRPPGQD